MAVRFPALRTGRPLPTGRFLVFIHVTGWADPKATVRLEGLGSLKNPMTSSEIEPTTFQFAASPLNKETNECQNLCQHQHRSVQSYTLYIKTRLQNSVQNRNFCSLKKIVEKFYRTIIIINGREFPVYRKLLLTVADVKVWGAVTNISSQRRYVCARTSKETNNFDGTWRKTENTDNSTLAHCIPHADIRLFKCLSHAA
jgi:hypothetical protein